MTDDRMLGQDDRRRTLDDAGFTDGLEVHFTTAALPRMH